MRCRSGKARWRTCRKLKLEHIDGVVCPRSVPTARDQLPALHAARVLPCARTNACEPRYSMVDRNEADDAHRDWAISDAHSPNTANEGVPIGRVSVANKISRRFLPATGFGPLTGIPFGPRMRRHPQPQQLPARMPQDQQSIQELKRDRRDDEHVDRCNGIVM